MRLSFLLLASVVSVYATELIYISNNANEEHLKKLEETYKQKLLINEGYVYLIPSDCRLNRYFGGASNGNLQLSKTPEQTQKIVLTQAVFEAKNETEITEKIEVEKSIALVEGKVSKAFLDDKEGRGYGGASEVPLDFSFQRIKATSLNMTPTKKSSPIKKDEKESKKPYIHPSCELLDNGSGYKLFHLKQAQFYSKGQAKAITKKTILFK